MITATEAMSKQNQTKLRENLAALRSQRGWSQSELARRSGVGQSTVSRIESGSHGDSDWSTIEALARALGVDAATLAGSKPPTAPAPERPAVGRVYIGDILPAYIASDWFGIDQPTHDEMRWLAGLGVITWTGAPPQPGTIHVLLEEHRKGSI